jgi:hypothetical protein
MEQPRTTLPYVMIPRALLADGWLLQLPSTTQSIFLAALAELSPDPRMVWDCETWVEVMPGQFLVSERQLAARANLDLRTVQAAMAKLGPAGVGFFSWQRASAHRNSKTLFTLTDPEMFIRPKRNAEAVKSATEKLAARAGQNAAPGIASNATPHATSEGGGIASNATPHATSEGGGIASNATPSNVSLHTTRPRVELIAGAEKERGARGRRTRARDGADGGVNQGPDAIGQPLSGGQFSFSLAAAEQPDAGQSETFGQFLADIMPEIERRGNGRA